MFRKEKHNITGKLLYSNKSNLKYIECTFTIIIILISLFVYIGDNMFRESEKHAANMWGKYHLEIRNINSVQMNIIENNKKIDQIGKVQKIYTNAIGDTLKVSLIGYYDEISKDLLNISLKKGSYPFKKNDIALEGWVVDYLGSKHKKYIALDNSIESGYYAKKLPKYYEIIGILDNNTDKYDEYVNINSYNGYVVPGLVSKIQADIIPKSQKKYYLYVNLDSVKNIEVFIDELHNYIKIPEKDIVINSNYIKELDKINNMRILTVIMFIIIIFIAIIILNNVYSNFNYNKQRNIGILRAIGCTKKQLNNIIAKEVLAMNLFSAVIGMSVGVIIYFLSILVLERFGFLEATNAITMENIGIILLSIFIISGICLLLNIVRISDKSVIEMLTVNSDIKYNKGIKHNNIMSKVWKCFNVIGKLSFKNLLRNFRKTKKSILCISIACILFILINSIQMQGNNFILKDKDNNSYLVQNGNINLDELSNIKKIEGVKHILGTQETIAFVSLNKEKAKSEKSLNLITKNHEEDESYMEINVIGTTEKMYESIKIISGEVDFKDIELNNKILVNQAFIDNYLNKNMDFDSDIEILFPKIGVRDVKYIPVKFQISGIVELENTSLEYSNDYPYAFVDKNLIKNIKEFEKVQKNRALREKNDQLGLQLGYEGRLEDGEKDINIYNQEAYDKYEKNSHMITIFMVFILTLISILSIISSSNDIMTNRGRELSIYRIIGMTKKQLREMILLEGFYLGISSSIIGIGSAVLITRMIKVFVEQNSRVVMNISVNWIIIIFISVNVMSIVTSFVSLRTLDKKKLSSYIRMIK